MSSSLDEKIDLTEALAIVAGTKAQMRDPSAPIPGYVCLLCGSIYGDKEATKVVHDDTNPNHKECACPPEYVVLVDLKKIKLNESGNVVAAVQL
jgi:hypothetical protein